MIIFISGPRRRIPDNLMRVLFYVLILWIVTTVFGVTVNAQTCTGSLGAPVVNETFGAGSTYGVGPALPQGITDLTYIADGCGGNDGTYTILTSMGSTCKGGTWQTIVHDHTGDLNGYMMIINATLTPNIFFTERVSGSKLCPNTTYQFASWIMNILRDEPQTKGYVKPNITFSIETVSGTILKTYNTGDIDATDNPIWKQYGTFFTSPADGSDVIVKMYNNASGGNGNDIALDDITFSPCGPLIQTGFGTIGDNADKNNCIDDNLNYTLVAQQEGYPDPAYQWQQNMNDGNGWVNIPGATTTTLPVVINKVAAGIYQYRIGVLSAANVGSENCRIYSDPLNINVYGPPVFTLAAQIGACEGHPLQLSSTGGDTYLWTGPNNYSTTENSPIVTNNADKSYDGVYTVRIIRNNCPLFASTTVTVYQTATLEPLTDVTICEGSATQLVAKSTNATHFKWVPSDGLDHDDIQSPMASPSVTTTYRLTVSNDGCPDIAPEQSLTVTVLKKPSANAGSPIKLMEGQTAKLNGTAQGDKIMTYWTPPDFLDDPTSLTPVTSATGDITYTLHVVSTADCGESTSTVFVRVYKKLTIYNAFSPNGDGINDRWDITNLATYPNALVSVYSRYGSLVFQSRGYGKAWDGTYNGSLLSAGTYYYIIDLNEDDLPKLSGSLLIIR